MRFWWKRHTEEQHEVWANEQWREQAEARLRALADAAGIVPALVAEDAVREAEAIVAGMR